MYIYAVLWATVLTWTYLNVDINIYLENWDISNSFFLDIFI